MVNIEELRIGNWVSYLGVNTQINSISIGESCGYVSTFKSGAVTLNQIEPIPLTEKLLLKCGFTKEYYGFFCDGMELSYGRFLCNNDADKDKLFLSINNAEYKISEVSLKYLHQLQNMYLDLTGKKLNTVQI